MNCPVPAAFVPTLCPELRWPSVYPDPTCPTAETLPVPVEGGQIPAGKQHQFVLPTDFHNYIPITPAIMVTVVVNTPQSTSVTLVTSFNDVD